jgi:hypothetical protein
MAATARNYDVTQIHQGPGDIWVIPVTVAPTDTAVRLTLATDGSPDSVAHAGAICCGLTEGGITFAIKQKFSDISVDQFDAPVDTYVDETEASIEATLAQQGVALLQNAYTTGVFSAQVSPGWNQITVGGTPIVPVACIAAISPKRTGTGLFVVSLLYQASAQGGLQALMARNKKSSHKVLFKGQSVPSRTAGKQIGVHYETI